MPFFTLMLSIGYFIQYIFKSIMIMFSQLSSWSDVYYSYLYWCHHHFYTINISQLVQTFITHQHEEVWDLTNKSQRADSLDGWPVFTHVESHLYVKLSLTSCMGAHSEIPDYCSCIVSKACLTIYNSFILKKAATSHL